MCAGDKIEIIYFMSSSEKPIATAWEFCNMLGLQCDCVSYNIIGGRPTHVSRCASRYYRNTSHNQNLVTDCITQTHPFPYAYLSQRPIREHLVCECERALGDPRHPPHSNQREHRRTTHILQIAPNSLHAHAIKCWSNIDIIYYTKAY